MAATPAAATRSRRSIRFLPALRGMTGADFPREILAGVTLAALAIPLNIGYADVAGLPAIVGLYAAVVPMLIWPLFCTSRHLVASPDAPVAALIGSLLITMAPAGDPRYIQLAYAQALVCALVFFVCWFFRLGFLANFLSRPCWSDSSAASASRCSPASSRRSWASRWRATATSASCSRWSQAIPSANLYCIGSAWARSFSSACSNATRHSFPAR